MIKYYALILLGSILFLSSLVGGCVTQRNFKSSSYIEDMTRACNNNVKSYNPRTGVVICHKEK